LNLIKDIVTNIRTSFRFERKESLTASILSELFFLPFNLLFLFTVLLVTPIVLLFCGVANMTLTTTVPTGASHVPPAYTPNTGEAVPLAVFGIFGAIFGGIHLIGWNFTYPTLVERTLWRVSALLITVIPTYIILTEKMLRYLSNTTRWGRNHGFVLFLGCIGVFLLIIYIFARFSLIVQSVVSLRRQPASAFYPVDWVTYFPHLS
jgi:hypothetical protein